MKLVFTFVLAIVAANVLTACCCCPTGGGGEGFITAALAAPQAQAVAEHAVAQASVTSEQKF